MPFTMQPMVQNDLVAPVRRIGLFDDLSIGAAGVCAIGTDRQTGILSGGADPHRSARAMGF